MQQLSLLQKLVKVLFYQKPQSPPVVFQAGLEDGPGPAVPEEKRRAENKRENRSGKKTDGMVKPKKARRLTPGEKYGHAIAHNEDISRVLEEQVELSSDLAENRKVLERIFRLPENKDAVFRSFTIGTEPAFQALLVFMDGITNSQVQNISVLQPLMLKAGSADQAQQRGKSGADYEDFLERVKESLLPNNQIAVVDNYTKAVTDILSGNSVLFIHSFNKALSLETKAWQARAVSTPQVEAVIRGPQEAFTELLRVNTSLVRKALKRPSLVTEFHPGGPRGSYGVRHNVPS